MSDLLQQFRDVLDQVGHDISAGKYDKLTIARPARKTLERRYKASWTELKAMATEDVVKDNTTYQALIRQNKALLDKLDAARDYNQTIIDACMSSLAKISFAPIKPPKRTITREGLEFHLMRSDAQVGQFTDLAWTQGVSQYNIKLYECRVRKLAEKVMLFREQDHKSLGLNKLVIYHLGDQVDGEGIFKGQAFSLDLAGVDQLFKAVEVEVGFILALAGVFPEVEIFCVPGNHGRPGRKGDNHPKTNFDYIFYRVLKMALEKQRNVQVYISESPSMLVEQGKFRFLLNHGDTAKSWNGIPYYGLDRAARKVPELYGMIINYNLCGHHHTPCNLADRVIMNGCLPGGSDFSVNALLAASRPSQKCFYFHPDHGINRESNLYLADPVRLEADDSGIYTAWV